MARARQIDLLRQMVGSAPSSRNKACLRKSGLRRCSLKRFRLRGVGLRQASLQ